MGTVRRREYPDGRKRWMVDYVDSRGVRRREVIKTPGAKGWRLAQRILRNEEAKAQLGQHDIRVGDAPRFADHARDWLARHRKRLKPNSIEKYEAFLKHLEPRFGKQSVGAIESREIDQFLTDLRERGARRSRYGKSRPLAPATINDILRCLKAILTDAIKCGFLAENPAAAVEPLPKRPPEDMTDDKVRHLEPEQLDRLIKAADQPWCDLWLFLGRTGLRRGEALGTKWEDVDLNGAQLQVRRSIQRLRRAEGKGYEVRESPLKTKYSLRTVPFTPDVVDMLRRRQTEAVVAGSAYIFWTHTNQPGKTRSGKIRKRSEAILLDPDNVDRALKRCLTLAELPGFFRVHDLRHTAASHLLAAGVPMKTVQAILGHASYRTTADIYGHLLSSSLEGVGERLEAFVRHVVGTRNGSKTEPIEEPAKTRI